MEGRPCWCEVELGEGMAVDVRRKPLWEGLVVVLEQRCSDSTDGAASNTGR